MHRWRVAAVAAAGVLTGSVAAANEAAITVEGKTEVKASGSFTYEPSTLVHQWGNPADEPFTFLVFNINPEGTAAVVPAPPTKAQ